VRDVREGEPGELGRAVAGQPAEGAVRLRQAKVVADEGHRHRAVLEHALEALARLPQRRLAESVLASVADGGHEHAPVGRLDRGQRDLGREFAAVTAQRGQFDARPGAAQAQPGTGEEPVDQAPHQLLARQPEEILHPRVHGADPVLPIHEQHRVRRELEQGFVFGGLRWQARQSRLHACPASSLCSP
jgi:hypothetical protein